MAKFRFVQWLWDWLLALDEFSFEWDAGNEAKSVQKHGVTCAEAEEVFHGTPVDSTWRTVPAARFGAEIWRPGRNLEGEIVVCGLHVARPKHTSDFSSAHE